MPVAVSPLLYLTRKLIIAISHLNFDVNLIGFSVIVTSTLGFN